MRVQQWLRPSMGDLLGVFLAIAVFVIGAQRLFGDSDPAMHVATGRWILTHYEVPKMDPFSATESGGEWFAHEWLADVGWALIHRAAGWAGLVATSAVLIAAANFLLYLLLIVRGDHVLPAFAAVLAAAAAATSHWLARPHLLTVLLLVVWTAILESVASGLRGPRWLTSLPLLIVFWSNLHGGFLVGLSVLGCYWIGILVEAKPWRGRVPLLPEAARARALVAPFFWTLVVSIAATCVNPWGWRLPAHLLIYFATPRAALAWNEEFAPASSGDRAGLAVFGFIGLCLLAIAAQVLTSRSRATAEKTRLHPGALLAFAMAVGMAIVSIRHAEVLAVFGAVVLSSGVSALLETRSGETVRREMEGQRRYELRHGGALFAATVVALAGLASNGYPRAAGYDPSLFPVDMVSTLRAAGVKPEGPVFAPDVWGGYLALEWPEAKVFVDGRSDMYGDRFMARYAAVWLAAPGWEQELAADGVAWVILPVGAPLAQHLERDDGWSTWAADPVALVFRRKNP